MVIKGLIERDAAGKLTLTKQGRAVLAELLMEGAPRSSPPLWSRRPRETETRRFASNKTPCSAATR
jgi:hypothetical protein